MSINTFTAKTVAQTVLVNQNFTIIQNQDIWNENLITNGKGNTLGLLPYTLKYTYMAGTTRVYIDGIKQRPGGIDYTETTPGSGLITFISGQQPVSGQDVYVDYRQVL